MHQGLIGILETFFNVVLDLSCGPLSYPHVPVAGCGDKLRGLLALSNGLGDVS